MEALSPANKIIDEEEIMKQLTKSTNEPVQKENTLINKGRKNTRINRP